jgi:hypothetical protein
MLERVERKPMGRQLKAVYTIMLFGEWETFASIKASLWRYDNIGISEAGVSARLRDLRKAEYGNHVIVRRPTEHKGIYEYRMVMP